MWDWQCPESFLALVDEPVLDVSGEGYSAAVDEPPYANEAF